MFRSIPAMHGAQNTVRAGLQRHVEMSRDARGCRDERDEILGDVLRLDGAEAQLLQIGFVEDPPDHLREIRTRGEVASIRAEIDAAENDFFRAGRNELSDFGDHDVRRQAATASANKGNHAVGAAVVAAILDFQDGARAISGNTLGAFNGGNLYGGLRENVARENFRRAAREGHRIAIEKGQRNEILAGSSFEPAAAVEPSVALVRSNPSLTIRGISV